MASFVLACELRHWLTPVTWFHGANLFPSNFDTSAPLACRIGQINSKTCRVSWPSDVIPVTAKERLCIGFPEIQLDACGGQNGSIEI